MTNYQKGANYEREVKKYYESMGWLVTRSAGSFSPIDLHITDLEGRTWLIQCKTGKVNPKHIQTILKGLKDLADKHKCMGVLWIKGQKEGILAI